MRKHWRVVIPGEAWNYLDPDWMRTILDGYTGQTWVDTGYDFMRHLVLVSGTHDPTDTDSQAAVARLVAVARTFTEPHPR